MSITNIIFKIVAYFVFIAFALSVFAIFSPFITQYFGFSLIEFLSPADARPDLAFPFYVLFTGISYVFDRDIFVENYGDAADDGYNEKQEKERDIEYESQE